MPKKSPGRKSATKTAKPKGAKPALIPQPNGRGALYAGGVPGNVGGTGRPPSALREILRQKFEDRIPVIEAIADGEMTERAQVPLSSVLRYAHCPRCNDQLKANEISDILTVTLEGKVSPKAKDRKEAVDMFAKYGLGTTKEITVEDVRGRMQNTLDAIKALPYPIESPDVIFAAMRPFWTVTK